MESKQSTRRGFLRQATAVCAGIGLPSMLHARSLKTSKRPNVLFIAVDDMADWCGCMGGHPDVQTPNIDRLARRGMLFTNAHCVSPICGPSRASVLTGMRPETTNVYTNQGTYVDYVPDAVSFPRYFRNHGYHVLGAGKINHASTQVVEENWDEYGPGTGIVGTPFTHEELMCEGMDPTRTISRGRLKCTLPMNGGLSMIDRPTNQWNTFDWGPLNVPDDELPDGQIANWAVEQLHKEHDKPFLLCTGFYKPHQPFFAPKKYFEMYDPEAIHLPPTIADDLKDVPQPGKDLALIPWTSGTHKTVTEHNQWRQAVTAYLATISFVDAQIGKVLDALDSSRHADNTWIVFWSDHGWSLGEKEHWGKHDPWRGSVKVPMIFVPPKNDTPSGFRPSQRCDAPVSLLDLYPTLLDMADLKKHDKLEGRSLLPLVSDPTRGWDETVVASVGRGSHSLFTKKWRYIHYFDGSEELYDLAVDSEEWFNLAHDPAYEGVMKQLSTRMPVDRRFRQFVRWGRWKCVYMTKGDILLFDMHETFGISEHHDVAKDRAQVIAKISQYLKDNNLHGRHVTMPDNG